MRAKFENYFKSDSISDYIIDELIANTPVSSMPAALTQYQTNAQILKESLVVQAIAEKAGLEIVSANNPAQKQRSLKYKVIDYLKEHAIYE
jgi:gentisate 1,2-dioxygenase